MTATRRITQTTLFALLVGLAACDDGEITTVEQQLSQAEVAELLEVLAAVGSFNPGVTGSAPQGVAGPQPVPFSFTVEWSFGCPEGGTVAATGSTSGDTEGQSGGLEASYNATLTYTECRGTSDEGTTFEIDGSLTTAIDFQLNEDTFALQGTHTGTLAWTSDGRSGSCTLDLTFSNTVTGTTQSSEVTGTVCGVTVNETVTVG